MTDDVPTQQLHMLWPADRLKSPPMVKLPAGYALRTYMTEDLEAMAGVMQVAGFKVWNKGSLSVVLQRALPEGIFFAVHQATGTLPATATATHNPLELHPFGGELGWVAADQRHRGKGLGTVVCAAVTERFLQAGYKRIYIRTDDWRLAAIKIYLKLGYVPFLFQSDMEQRWGIVCEKLNCPFNPDDWRRITEHQCSGWQGES